LLLRGPSTIGVWLIILCSACMVYYHLGIFLPSSQAVRAAQGFGEGYGFGADFYPIWLTSREGLLQHRDPYSPEMTREIQQGLFGHPLEAHSGAPQDYRAFAYPAFVDLLFWPAALLPFSIVRIGIAVILATATVFSLILWLKVLRLRARPAMLASLILLTLSSYAVMEGLFADQMGLLLGFLLAASLAALVRQKLFFSGSLMALALIKPQMMALLAGYLFLWSCSQWRERQRFVWGFLVNAVVLVGMSVVVWPAWIPKWLHVLLEYRTYSTPPLVPYLLGDWIGSRLGPIFIGLLLAGAIALAWRARHAAATSFLFAWTVSILLAITTIGFLPGHAVYDHVVLLPGIILISACWRGFAASNRIFRRVLPISALALLWQWIAAPVVMVLRTVLSRQLFPSPPLALPFRTAASIPFCVLALLALMVWKQPRIATEDQNFA
jgi:Glycosyltransferase family 87